MSYVVTDNCIKCKYTDCIEVCPVECFYTSDDVDMVFIDPMECIDCGVCVDQCPIDAIHPESPELLPWLELAKEFSAKLPNITKKQNPPIYAEEYKNKSNKLSLIQDQLTRYRNPKKQ